MLTQTQTHNDWEIGLEMDRMDVSNEKQQAVTLQENQSYQSGYIHMTSVPAEMVRFSYIIMVALLGDKMRLAEPYFMYYT